MRSDFVQMIRRRGCPFLIRLCDFSCVLHCAETSPQLKQPGVLTSECIVRLRRASSHGRRRRRRPAGRAADTSAAPRLQLLLGSRSHSFSPPCSRPAAVCCSDMEAQLEICVHLEKFKNIDLYSQGYVFIRLLMCGCILHVGVLSHRVAVPCLFHHAGFTNFESRHLLIQAAAHSGSSMQARSLRANMHCPTMRLLEADHSV
jgi:hypothetical protein